MTSNGADASRARKLNNCSDSEKSTPLWWSAVRGAISDSESTRKVHPHGQSGPPRASRRPNCSILCTAWFGEWERSPDRRKRAQGGRKNSPARSGSATRNKTTRKSDRCNHVWTNWFSAARGAMPRPHATIKHIDGNFASYQRRSARRIIRPHHLHRSHSARLCKTRLMLIEW